MTEERDRDRALARLVSEAFEVDVDVPREELWRGIEERISFSGAKSAGRGRRAMPGRGREIGGRGLIAAGLALLFVGYGLGYGLGRSGALGGGTELALGGGVGDGGVEEEAGVWTGTTLAGSSLAPTAFAHLSEVDFLLAALQREAGEEWMRGTAVHWAESLLPEARLLRRLHRNTDPALAALLNDLELVLLQVARLDEAARERGRWDTEEVRLIAEALESGELRPRIRSFLPGDRPGQ